MNFTKNSFLILVFLNQFYTNWLPVFSLSAATSAFAWNSAVKTEKKTVQFSEEIQVETIEPEQEPVYIDEVNAASVTRTKLFFNVAVMH